MSLAKGFFTVSGLTIVSRVFGILREAVMTHFLGASIEMDAFTTAFKFPCFFRKFFAEGGFQSIFVPYYADFHSVGKSDEAREFSSSIFSLVFWVVGLLTATIMIFAREFTILMAPGFTAHADKLELATDFVRIIILSVAFISLSTIYSGILVTCKLFFQFAMCPILVNCILVTSLLLFQDTFSAGNRASYGVLASGIFQFFYMYAYVKRLQLPGPTITRIRMTQEVKSFLKKLTPVLAGAGVAQVNVLTGLVYASFLPTGCVTYLHCADRFVQLPLALFGISMGIVLLPEISERIARKQESDTRCIQEKSLLFTMRLTLPSVVGLVALSVHLISLIYGHGRFPETAVISTAKVLQVAALGLPAYVASKIASSILFAQKDASTPIRAAVMSIIANVVLGGIFIVPLAELGLALANSIAGVINVFVMCRKMKMSWKANKATVITLVKILVASLVMWIATQSIDACYERTGMLSEISAMSTIFSGGLVVYIASLYLLGDAEMKKIIAHGLTKLRKI
ncbi:MAG: murein biosynthesis integral membrane protein MurJ [Holosporales bacterium]|jgi:putative peptidoglycan lipid II flippase|nr:murein biosynthesis integral membrane protein MurJ [Holosporales bacterium]